MGSIWEVLYRNQGRLFELFWAMTLVVLIAGHVFMMEVLAGSAALLSVVAQMLWPISAAIMLSDTQNRAWLRWSTTPLLPLLLFIGTYYASVAMPDRIIFVQLNSLFFSAAVLSFIFICLRLSFQVSRVTSHSIPVTFFSIAIWLLTRDIPKNRIDLAISSKMAHH